MAQRSPAFCDGFMYAFTMSSVVHSSPAADVAVTRAVGTVGVYLVFGPLIGAAMVSLGAALGDLAAILVSSGFRPNLLAVPFTVITGTVLGLFVAYMAGGLHALVIGCAAAASAAATGRPSYWVTAVAALGSFLAIGRRDWSAPLFQAGLALVIVGAALGCCWIARRLLDTLAD